VQRGHVGIGRQSADQGMLAAASADDKNSHGVQA
jgi:hypothetical protein